VVETENSPQLSSHYDSQPFKQRDSYTPKAEEAGGETIEPSTLCEVKLASIPEIIAKVYMTSQLALSGVAHRRAGKGKS
jgi:hypothetical protein